jgi:hypothetical protein
MTVKKTVIIKTMLVIMKQMINVDVEERPCKVDDNKEDGGYNRVDT